MATLIQTFSYDTKNKHLTFQSPQSHHTSILFQRIYRNVHGCSEIDGHIFLLDLLVQELFLHKSHWFKVLSILMKIQPEHLIALNLKHIKYFSKPFHFCHLLSVWFLPFFAFFFFIFIFWSTETTTANLQGLTHLTPSKNTNQVTLHNKHRNHLIWA